MCFNCVHLYKECKIKQCLVYKEAIESGFSIGNGVMKITFDLTLHWVHSTIFTSGHNLKYTVSTVYLNQYWGLRQEGKNNKRALGTHKKFICLCCIRLNSKVPLASSIFLLIHYILQYTYLNWFWYRVGTYQGLASYYTKFWENADTTYHGNLN